MKYFICALDKINLGIPAEQTEQIIPVTWVQSAVRETKDQEVFISLPALFRQKDTAAPHGVVLKSKTSEPSSEKTILLVPRIDVEMEIPEENIFGLPEVLAGLFTNFKGAYCTGQSVILILDPEKLLGAYL